MHVKYLTMRAFPLVIFNVLFTTKLDVDAKSMALKKIDEYSLDNEETLQTLQKDTPQERGSVSHIRKRRYKVGFKFNKMLITWTVVKYSTKLTHHAQDKVFTDAFKKWASVTVIDFAHINDQSKADIVITFTKVDGPGSILAHASLPTHQTQYRSDIIFDEEESWVTTITGGANLVAIALHEIGHSLGIAVHLPNSQAVMASQANFHKINLHADDIEAIRRKYGRCKVENITAVLHDSTKTDDTVLVLNKGKVYRIWVSNGGIFDEFGDTWPKDIRTYFKMTDARFDNVFPLRAAMLIFGYNYMYFYGQKDLIRRQIKPPNTFKEETVFVRSYLGWLGKYGYKRVPEGPLPYDKPNIMHTPDFFKDFLKTNAKFGAAFQHPYQHYFGNGFHYKIQTHDFSQHTKQDINIDFPGAPRDPDAAWYNQKNEEWWFFKGDKYYKFDKSINKFTDRGPIGVLWPTVCE